MINTQEKLEGTMRRLATLDLKGPDGVIVSRARQTCQNALDDIRQIKADLARAEDHIAYLEKMRPHWAQGFTEDSQAAQVCSSALAELWAQLDVSDQTAAIRRLRTLTDAGSQSLYGLKAESRDVATKG